MKNLILPAGIALAAVCAAAVTAANSSDLTFDNDLPWQVVVKCKIGRICSRHGCGADGSKSDAGR